MSVLPNEYKVLIVEDDITIAKELKIYLQTWGYKCEIVTDLQTVIKQFADFNPHIVLLDITLPYYDGYYWCEAIREVSDTPIVFISSATDKMNKIMAMTMGADDFVDKPFDLDLLIVKIKALLRRTYDFTGKYDLIEHKSVVLNLYNSQVTYDNKTIELTKNEFKILSLLMQNKRKIVSRENIMIDLWDSENYIDDNTLTVNVSRLREKLGEIGVEGYITTQKGMGYIIK